MLPEIGNCPEMLRNDRNTAQSRGTMGDFHPGATARAAERRELAPGHPGALAQAKAARAVRITGGGGFGWYRIFGLGTR